MACDQQLLVPVLGAKGCSSLQANCFRHLTGLHTLQFRNIIKLFIKLSKVKIRLRWLYVWGLLVLNRFACWDGCGVLCFSSVMGSVVAFSLWEYFTKNVYWQQIVLYDQLHFPHWYWHMFSIGFLLSGKDSDLLDSLLIIRRPRSTEKEPFPALLQFVWCVYNISFLQGKPQSLSSVL